MSVGGERVRAADSYGETLFWIVLGLGGATVLIWSLLVSWAA